MEKKPYPIGIVHDDVELNPGNPNYQVLINGRLRISSSKSIERLKELLDYAHIDIDTIQFVTREKLKEMGFVGISNIRAFTQEEIEKLKKANH